MAAWMEPIEEGVLDFFCKEAFQAGVAPLPCFEFLAAIAGGGDDFYLDGETGMGAQEGILDQLDLRKGESAAPGAEDTTRASRDLCGGPRGNWSAAGGIAPAIGEPAGELADVALDEALALGEFLEADGHGLAAMPWRASMS
jgi:hypothetical protein